MRRPSLAFLAILPLLQQMPKDYTPSEGFGSDPGPAPEKTSECEAVKDARAITSKHLAYHVKMMSQAECEHQWEAAGHEGPYWISECKLCGTEKSRP